MLRVLAYIIVVALIVAGAVWLAERPGDVTLVWQGWRVDTSVPILLLAIGVFIAIVWAIVRVLKGIGAIPGVVRESVREKRRRRGLSALGSGYAAVAGRRRPQGAVLCRRRGETAGRPASDPPAVGAGRAFVRRSG